MRSVGGEDQRSGLERIVEISLWLIVLCFGPQLFYLFFANLLTTNSRKRMEMFKYHVINPVTVISVCS